MKAKHLIYKTTNPGFDNIPSLTFNIKPLSSNWHELFSFRWGKFKFNIKQFLNMFGIMFYSLNSILFDIQVQHIIFSLRHFFRVREASSFFSFIQLKVHICLSTTFYKKKKIYEPLVPLSYTELLFSDGTSKVLYTHPTKVKRFHRYLFCRPEN